MKKKVKRSLWNKKSDKCEHRDWCDCPHCGCSYVCCHEDSTNDECEEETCPMWDAKKKKWGKKEHEEEGEE